MKKTTPVVLIKKPSQIGKWVAKKTISKIVTCDCGNKYIATRKDQIGCMACFYKKSSSL